MCIHWLLVTLAHVYETLLVRKDSTYLYIFTFIVLRVLKENYTRLCRSLPQDYNKTINKLKQLLKLHDESADNLVRLPTADLINERIIVLLIGLIKSEKEALTFCAVIKRLTSTVDIETLRKGISTCISKRICGYK